MKIYAAIIKRDDDKRLVYGYASTEALDSQGEKVTKAAIEDALPDYMRFANIREMHQLSAVGVTKSAEIDDKGLYIQVKVVDDAAWNKVKEGVYKGFSIGGKSVEKTDGVISKMKLTEISLVDRPSNPEAVIDLWKADTTGAVDELAAMINSGSITPAKLVELAKAAQITLAPDPRAMPDGTFLINKADDIKHALRAFVLAKDSHGTKAHIIKRAAELKAVDQLPPRWAAADGIQKGLGQVAWLAHTLESIACLQRENAFEQEYEGDTSSTAPAALAEWLDSGLKILGAMVTEESAELMGTLRVAPVVVEVIEAAALPGDITKGGAKFSADTKDKLTKAHGHIKKAADHMAKAKAAPFGEAADHLAKCDASIGKADSAMESVGYEGEDKDEANKVVAAAADADVIAKATAPLLERLTKAEEVSALVPALLKRLETLEAQPLPPKGQLRVIGKTDTEVDALDILAGAKPEDIALAQIKKAHRDGGTRIA